MSERIVLRTGEALVEGPADYLCAEPEVVINALDVSAGTFWPNPDRRSGSRAPPLPRRDPRTATCKSGSGVFVIASKVTVKKLRPTANILMGTVQAAIANGVLDAVRAGDIPRDQVNDLGIIYSVWLDPSVVEVAKVDHQALFDIHREATRKVIRKAMRNEPTIDWLLENQVQVVHYFHQQGLEGNL